MSLRYGVLCFFLFIVVLLLAFKNYETWSHPSARISKIGTIKKSGTKIQAPPHQSGLPELPSPSSLMIVEKNIFNPDRKEFPISMMEQQKQIVRPQILLYGVAIAGDYQTASIVNPGRPLLKGEREMTTVKVGDRIGDYRVSKILPDRIVVEVPGDSFEALLFDPRFPKNRAEIKTSIRPPSVSTPYPSSTPMPVPAPIPVPTPVPMPMEAPRSTPPVTTPRPMDIIPGGQGTMIRPTPVNPVPVPEQDIWRGRMPVQPTAPNIGGGR